MTLHQHKTDIAERALQRGQNLVVVAFEINRRDGK